jgi:hypothetical protein
MFDFSENTPIESGLAPPKSHSVKADYFLRSA